MACPQPVTFASFVSGALDATAREALELHVDTCETCRLALSETARSATAEPRASAIPEVGDTVGRYRIAGRLGEGAMGVVFLAHDPALGRDLAIKLVSPQAGDAETELVRQRMLREGRALARIDHDNVVRVFDVGNWRGAVFVALARAPGVTLREWLAVPRSIRAIVAVFRQCAAGLAAAHAAGIVHRDVKPDNVIVDEHGHARVTDFGLATSDGASASLPFAAGSGDPRITRTRGAVGTPAYAAPEQLRGEPIDARADQFALCVALAEALAGRRPDESERRALGDREDDVSDRRVELAAAAPRWLRATLRRGLASDPAARFPSMTALADALVPPRRWPFVAGGAIAGLAAAVVLAGAAGVRPWGESATDACAARTPELAPLAAVFERHAFGADAWRYARSAAERYAGELRAACRAGAPALPCERGLAALVELWRTGEPGAIAGAVAAVDALPPVATCTGPLEVTLVDGMRGTQLAIARAERAAGRLRAARARLLSFERAGDAEVLVELGRIDAELGAPADARTHLVAAVAAGELAGHTRAKSEAWISLAELAGERVQLAEARDAVRLAAAAIERLGSPRALASRHAVAAGLVALRGGDHAAAVAHLQRSLVDGGELGITERARRMQILARALIASGDVPRALSTLEEAERAITAVLGRDAPALVFVLNSMIEPLEYLGRKDDAIARGVRALAVFDGSFGRDDARRDKIAGNLATVYANRGDIDHALALEREREASAVVHHGPAAYEVGVARTNLATTLLDAGRAEEALAPLASALAIFTAKLGARHPLVANVHSSLAHAHLLLRRTRTGVEHARTALAIREEANVGAGHIAFTRFVLAQALAADGRREAGIAMARQALEIPLGREGREAALAADIRAWLAEQEPGR